MQAVDPLSDQEVDIMKRHLRELFPDLDLSKLQKMHTKKVESYNRWIEKHCKISQYVFQIKKCSDEQCCSGSVLPREELTWLPDPIIEENGEHYKPYSEVNGQDTTEADRPSLKERKVTKKATKNQGLPNVKQTLENKDDMALPVNQEDEDTSTELLEVPVADSYLCMIQNSRFICICSECRKPRVIYSRHKLTDRQKLTLAISISEHEYTCG